MQGVEGAAKRPRAGYIPTSRGLYTTNVAINFGPRRARFPASGRRRKSYDSLLHAFAKKTGPSRFRRSSVLRFKRAVPRIKPDFREHLLKTFTSSNLNRRRSLLLLLSGSSYLSAPWRESLQYRAGRDQLSPAPAATIYSTKRRFLSIPLNAIRNVQAQHALRIVSPYKQQMRVIRAGILRRALRRRRLESAFVDLKRSALRSRLTKEQAARP